MDHITSLGIGLAVGGLVILIYLDNHNIQKDYDRKARLYSYTGIIMGLIVAVISFLIKRNG